MPRRSLSVKLAIVSAFVLAAGAAAWWLLPAPTVSESDPTRDPEGRVATARVRRGEAVAARFSAAGLHYPPRELFLRAFKHEAELEAWARDGDSPFVRVHTFAVTHSSGGPGPKRREGDRQVPEGFYTIDRFNPVSLYHLSMRVDYPNASDRLLSDPEKPGFDIYVHGGNGSVGCLPLGDDGIEELYLMCLDAGNRGAIPLHIFPARMTGETWTRFAVPHTQENPALAAFWESLRPSYEAFERTRQVPKITVKADGTYQVANGK